MCASHTADVVLPVPGLRLSKATLRAGTPTLLQLSKAAHIAGTSAVLQYLRHYGSRAVHAGGGHATVGSVARAARRYQQPVDDMAGLPRETARAMHPPCGKLRRLCRQT